MPSILMVCLGNICRSPMAEAAMRSAADDVGEEIWVDSAGTAGWHIGKAPDARGQQVVMQKAGIDIGHYKARQVQISDFNEFDYIFAMDTQNLLDLYAIQPDGSKAKLSLLLNDGGKKLSVADPYYGNIYDFETVWHQVKAASENIIGELQLGNL